jgi:protocatechuate 3,4-dioxygenase beta subunit
MSLPRRQAMRAAATLALAGLPWHVLARVVDAADGDAPAATPRLTDGPYYPVAFARDPGVTLVTGALVPQARPMSLSGRVVDRGGRPVAGARVEIWQCDANRRYHHPADDGATPLDTGFAGCGWQPSGADGAYRFETIRPVAYPGRTPHIHVKVKLDRRPVLSSQIFMPDESASNQRDFLWRQLGREAQPLALATMLGDAQARFDIVVG